MGDSYDIYVNVKHNCQTSRNVYLIFNFEDNKNHALIVMSLEFSNIGLSN